MVIDERDMVRKKRMARALGMREEDRARMLCVPWDRRGLRARLAHDRYVRLHSRAKAL